MSSKGIKFYIVTVFYFLLVESDLRFWHIIESIARAMKTKAGAPITADEIKLDENHPPPEALGYTCPILSHTTNQMLGRKLALQVCRRKEIFIWVNIYMY